MDGMSMNMGAEEIKKVFNNTLEVNQAAGMMARKAEKEMSKGRVDSKTPTHLSENPLNTTNLQSTNLRPPATPITAIRLPKRPIASQAESPTSSKKTKPLTHEDMRKIPADSPKIFQLLQQDHGLRDAIRKERAELIFAPLNICSEYEPIDDDPARAFKSILKGFDSKRKGWRAIPSACAVCTVNKKISATLCKHPNGPCEWCSTETAASTKRQKDPTPFCIFSLAGNSDFIINWGDACGLPFTDMDTEN